MWVRAPEQQAAGAGEAGKLGVVALPPRSVHTGGGRRGCPYRHVRSIQESERWAREVRPEEPLGAVSAHSSPPSWLPAPPWDA